MTKSDVQNIGKDEISFSRSDCSLPLIIVGNSPNMRETGFFLDCWLLFITDGYIWIPYLARYPEKFTKPSFQVNGSPHSPEKCFPRRNRKPSDHEEHQKSTIFGLHLADSIAFARFLHEKNVILQPGNPVFSAHLFLAFLGLGNPRFFRFVLIVEIAAPSKTQISSKTMIAAIRAKRGLQQLSHRVLFGFRAKFCAALRIGAKN